MKVSDIFREALKSFFIKGLTQSKLADDLGIHRNLMSDFLKGRRNFSDDRKEEISAYLGKTYIEMLNIGNSLISGEPKDSSVNRELTVQIQNKHEGNLFKKNSCDYRGVPLYESGRLAAWSNGAAFDLYEKPTSEVIVYSPELKHRASHKLVAVKVGGDSMQPLIPKGAIVIVDRDDREFIDNKIFAVCIEEGGVQTAAVKKVRKFKEAKGFALWSENEAYPPVFVTEQDWPTLCIGRVVWMWRSFECF